MTVPSKKPPTPRERSQKLVSATYQTRHDLISDGVTRHRAAAAVSSGSLLRLRRGRYVTVDTPQELQRAGSLGGRLDCLSLLKAAGVFVHTCKELHVQIEVGASRLPRAPEGTVRHWRPSALEPQRLAVDLVDALAQSFRCQGLRQAIASVDSAWHHDLIDEESVAAVFGRLPARFQPLRGLVDSRAESGPETLMRLILRGLGCHIDVQVCIAGVGRVDFVVDGWLIVECDSKAHHEGWEKQKEDRRRDLAAAAQGYSTVRPLAEDILYHPERVLRIFREALATPPAPGRRLHNSSDLHAD